MSFLAETQRRENFYLGILKSQTSVLVEPHIILSGLILVYVGYAIFGLALAELGLFLIITFRLLPVFNTILLTQQSYLSNLISIQIIIKRLDELSLNQEVDDIKCNHLERPIREVQLRDVGFSYKQT